jgi:acetylornithine aminotransferase
LLSEVNGVRDIRGRGLLLAAVLDDPIADRVVAASLAEGLVVNNVRADAVRFAPPLSISPAEVEEAVERFAAAIAAEPGR